MKTKPTTRLIESPLFAGLNRKELSHLAGLATEVEVKAGRTLARQGETGKEFAVIVEGAATVTVDGHKVATLGPGDHYGEMALLTELGSTRHKRAATVVAATDMVIEVMSMSEFRTLLAEFPDVAAAIRRAAVVRNADNHTGH